MNPRRSMLKTPRTRRLLLALTLLCFAACGRQPPNPVESRLAGLPCDYWRDPESIVHVRGTDTLPALACLGYAHAKDRAWQMDFLRRIARGQKAEVIGKDAIRSDFLMRMLDLGGRADLLFQKLSAENQERFWAYAHGVNRGLREAQDAGVYEFQDLGYSPAPWHPSDSIALLLLQSFDQTKKSFEHDILEANHPGESAPEDGLPWDTSVLKKDELAARTATQSRHPDSSGPSVTSNSPDLALFQSSLKEDQGSNNWVVSPARSKTGHAWLANDPHLGLRHPPFWHWVHVQGGTINAIGASLAGIPVIVSGANASMAWGITNAYLDVADAVLVKDAELKNSKRSWPLIWFRFWKLKLPFFFKSFERTPQGWPILPLDSPAGTKIVLRWSGFDVTPEDIGAFQGLMLGNSVEELDRSLAKVGIPAWNFVFADTQGGIGYRVVGKIPARSSAPEPGTPLSSLSKLEEWNCLTPQQMPSLLNPKRGYIVTANNRQWPASYRYHGGRAYSEGFRAFRIEELLLRTSRHDWESHQSVQCDVQSVDARFFVPLLLKQSPPRNVRERQAQQALREWKTEDYRADLKCRACGVYRRWMDRALEEFDLSEAGLYRKLSQAITPAERARLQQALESALRDLGATETDPLPEWGKLHRNSFKHLAGLEFTSFEPLATPGDQHSVNPGTLQWDSDSRTYVHTSGASQRLIVELSSPPKLHAILAGPNQDTRAKSLSDPQGPWAEWVRCEQRTVRFPLDWSSVAARKIPL